MRLRTIEKIVPLPLPVLRQRITVLCEQEPKRCRNNALHTNEERVSLTINGHRNEVVYAMVRDARSEGDTTSVTIETFMVNTNWPVFLAIYVTATIFYVSFVHPSNLQLWLPIIILWGLAIKPIFWPLLRSNVDEKKLMESVDKLLDEMAGVHPDN